jgi:SlyX protein
MTPSPSDESIRISELETRITFQEDLIDKLHRSLFEQSQAFDRLALKVDSLATAIRSGQGSGGDEGQEPPPPHY